MDSLTVYRRPPPAADTDFPMPDSEIELAIPYAVLAVALVARLVGSVSLEAGEGAAVTLVLGALVLWFLGTWSRSRNHQKRGRPSASACGDRGQR